MSNTKQRCKQINLLHHLKTPNRTPRSIFMLNKRFSKSSKKKKKKKGKKIIETVIKIGSYMNLHFFRCFD